MYTNVLDNRTAIEPIPSVQPVCNNTYGLVEYIHHGLAVKTFYWAHNSPLFG